MVSPHCLSPQHASSWNLLDCFAKEKVIYIKGKKEKTGIWVLNRGLNDAIQRDENRTRFLMTKNILAKGHL